MQVLDCLRRCPLFNLFPVRELQVWLGAGEELTCSLGETIFQEGQAGVWAYLVLDGRIRIVRRAKSGREVLLGQLGPSEIFGEYALLPPHRNTATCRAATAARLLRLPLLPLVRLISTRKPIRSHLKSWLRLHGLVGYLRSQAFLGFMSAPSALTFLDALQPVTVHALRTIQADGLSADRWHFIQQGQVWLNAPAGTTGEAARELGPGDCFGERALLGQADLPVAVALTEVHCLCLDRTAFMPEPERSQESSFQSLVAELSTTQRRYPWVGQREEADCGVAALAMIARFHSLAAAVEVIRGSVRLGAQGANLLELQRAAQEIGLSCQAVRVDVDQFERLTLPAMVHLNSGHYVVLYELSGDVVVVGDPASGIIRLSRQQLAQQCSGRLLLAHPLANPHPPSPRAAC